jgi:hypothetical protein
VSAPKIADRKGYEAFWAKVIPPVIPAKLGMLAQMKQRFSGAAGMQNIASAIAGGFGGGGIGAMAGALFGPIGAAIGMAVSQIIAQLRRLFDFLKNGIMEAASFAAKLRAIQAQTGIKAGTGALMYRAAEAAGVDPNAVALEWGRFQANLSNIQKTTPQVASALASLGLSIGSLRKLSPDQQFNAIASALANTKNASNAAGAALALFNRHGVELLRIFKDPMTMQIAIQAMGESARLLDENGGKLRDMMAYFSRVFTAGIATQATAFFTGVFSSAKDALTSLAQAMMKIDWTKLGQLVGRWLKPFIEDMALIVSGIAKLINAMKQWGVALDKLTDMVLTRAAFLVSPASGVLWIIKEWMKKRNPPKPDDTPPVSDFGKNNGARLFDPMSFFGKGAGDQWSKIGAFSFTGGTNPISVGLSIQQEIAKNTKEAATYLRNMAKAAVPFTMNSAPVSPMSGWDSTPTSGLNNTFNANTGFSLNRGY